MSNVMAPFHTAVNVPPPCSRSHPPTLHRPPPPPPPTRPHSRAPSLLPTPPGPPSADAPAAGTARRARRAGRRPPGSASLETPPPPRRDGALQRRHRSGHAQKAERRHCLPPHALLLPRAHARHPPRRRRAEQRVDGGGARVAHGGTVAPTATPPTHRRGEAAEPHRRRRADEPTAVGCERGRKAVDHGGRRRRQQPRGHVEQRVGGGGAHRRVAVDREGVEEGPHVAGAGGERRRRRPHLLRRVGRRVGGRQRDGEEGGGVRPQLDGRERARAGGGRGVAEGGDEGGVGGIVGSGRGGGAPRRCRRNVGRCCRRCLAHSRGCAAATAAVAAIAAAVGRQVGERREQRRNPPVVADRHERVDGGGRHAVRTRPAPRQPGERRHRRRVTQGGECGHDGPEDGHVALLASRPEECGDALVGHLGGAPEPRQGRRGGAPHVGVAVRGERRGQRLDGGGAGGGVCGRCPPEAERARCADGRVAVGERGRVELGGFRRRQGRRQRNALGRRGGGGVGREEAPRLDIGGERVERGGDQGMADTTCAWMPERWGGMPPRGNDGGGTGSDQLQLRCFHHGPHPTSLLRSDATASPPPIRSSSAPDAAVRRAPRHAQRWHGVEPDEPPLAEVADGPRPPRLPASQPERRVQHASAKDDAKEMDCHQPKKKAKLHTMSNGGERMSSDPHKVADHALPPFTAARRRLFPACTPATCSGPPYALGGQRRELFPAVHPRCDARLVTRHDAAAAHGTGAMSWGRLAPGARPFRSTPPAPDTYCWTHRGTESKRCVAVHDGRRLTIVSGVGSAGRGGPSRAARHSMADGGRRWVDAGIDVCTGEARGRYQRGWKHLLTVTAKLMKGDDDDGGGDGSGVATSRRIVVPKLLEEPTSTVCLPSLRRMLSEDLNIDPPPPPRDRPEVLNQPVGIPCPAMMTIATSRLLQKPPLRRTI
ncbi:LOW QUALITY PROTEIN: hypothetical protein BU14_0103s0024 [Porphyra umbilicalis]|uniref:Uncharacterized protein n=1 Tax=Porphyra umbilicalis TaxID=2786 RepID=A0A1X6PD66_PORUM|nr:LOW QUALITY PROTEIN: hypothetical protein BU14_0103s0024 [Porphyra umbilicalis]|eukprot:OSX78680.1 LOW QUALITY PROTEIN: hypothetical protein BU14_0103s0024 [Porphyra umbilicalis]